VQSKAASSKATVKMHYRLSFIPNIAAEAGAHCIGEQIKEIVTNKKKQFSFHEIMGPINRNHELFRFLLNGSVSSSAKPA
jgi:hypothetical protein